MSDIKTTSTLKPITPSQALKLSGAFLEAAADVDDYCARNKDSLTAAAKEELEFASTDLQRASRRLRNLSIQIGIRNLAAAVERIVVATKKIDEFLKTVANVKKAMRAAAALVSLAAAVSTGNAGGVMDALGSLDHEIAD